jgi:hypothetical protein
LPWPQASRLRTVIPCLGRKHPACAQRWLSVDLSADVWSCVLHTSTASLSAVVTYHQRLAPALLPWTHCTRAAPTIGSPSGKWLSLNANHYYYKYGSGFETELLERLETELLERLVIGLPARIKWTQAIKLSHHLHRRKTNLIKTVKADSFHHR